MVDKLEACPCGRDDSADNAVQEASVNLVIVKAATGGRAYRVECGCGWAGPIERFAEEAIAAWNTRPTPTEDARERVKVLEEALQEIKDCTDDLGAWSIASRALANKDTPHE